MYKNITYYFIKKLIITFSFGLGFFVTNNIIRKINIFLLYK